ncbi:hypothetical protein [Loktanella sp. 5RATIMAR09]|uniref:hypothetical protein n=1 Tax=Loktanella sp. 5RATIMAR09 TaxID=1225655 RepID=UPI000AC011A0|nr:hypothetical protein [Loktanella sp. 5RATIMAR09]
MTYHLDATAAGTVLGISVAVSSFTGPETLAEVQQGWQGGADNLERYVAKITADA